MILSLMKRCIVAEEVIATEPDLAGYLGMSELLDAARNLLANHAAIDWQDARHNWIARYDALQSPATAAPQPGTAPPS